jgi:hypothetical protein
MGNGWVNAIIYLVLYTLSKWIDTLSKWMGKSTCLPYLVNLSIYISTLSKWMGNGWQIYLPTLPRKHFHLPIYLVKMDG